MFDLVYTYLESPIGPLLLAGDGIRLSKVGFPNGKGRVAPHDHWRRDDGQFIEARAQLSAYFAGELRTFHLDLMPAGTPFQLAVWQALTAIPYGATMSYGELARRIDRPSASRAVGAANGANPIPIIVPCHRVIGTSGALTGFGGGIDTKRWLVAHETGGNPGDLQGSLF
ncbi:cysteine methyltransferase [Pleomorphomonas diazotrophica]|uniref:Methylated-DNA--protein-cysteine methyltransferase n=1 Tax=Pleomorphomonas diazotrophica TaxID=1166257 RepID=A0A1I4QKC8_9HYPH|nr:methylated-DNA--[protein]-cysteine S-methyltransferase [Pleomorphomonas diazotrophica]PKR90617.1 cysteine methyltransferase [Pleomorphomonas diazotrophica]SFM40216.1 methylated-DNA-[protein]-cysteine S-methyltransferase [Pleomorphomonas diazotrophica]